MRNSLFVRHDKKIVASLFFITGFCSLTYQVAWNKILNQTVGTDFVSMTLIVSIFMFGLGLGGYLGSLLTRGKYSIHFYFAAEILVAIFGLYSDSILRSIPEISNQLVAGFGPKAFAADLLLNGLVLLIPTLLMGISLPIVVHFFRNQFSGGAAAGFLYSVNVMGAAFGAYTTGIFLIGTLGVQSTIRAASFALIGVIGSVFALVLSDYYKSGSLNLSDQGNPNQQFKATRDTPAHIYVVSFFIGFIALAFEILYFRFFAVYFKASTYVFPTLLTAYLVHIFIGNYWAGLQIEKNNIPRTMWKIVAYGSLSTLFVLIAPYIMSGFQSMDAYLFEANNGFTPLFFGLIISIIVFTPVCFISAFFPIFVHELTQNKDDLGVNVGKIYVVQTFGNFLGSVLTGFVFIPLFGTLLYLKFLGVGLILVGGYHALTFYGRDVFCDFRFKIQIVGAIGIFLACILVINEHFSFKNFKYNYISPSRIVDDFEGIGFLYDFPNRTRIHIGSQEATSYQTINEKFTTWPMDVATALIGAQKTALRILIIGIGPGIHAAALKKLYPDSDIIIVELIDLVMKEIRSRGSELLKDLVTQTHVVIADGRRYVNKQAVLETKFDLIQVGVHHVTSAGAGNLFTKEFLERLRILLTPDGVLTFNAYLSSVKVALDIFPNAIIAAKGEKEVADIFLLKNTLMTPKKFLSQYVALRKSIKDRFKNDPLLELGFTGREFFIFDRDAMRLALREISPQLDDLVATEFYLTNRINWMNESDPRIWKKLPGALMVQDSLEGKI